MNELFGHKQCRDGCGKVVSFSTSERAANGTLRPLNIDGSRHSCNSKYGRLENEFRNSLIDENGWVQQAELYIREINQHLQKSTIKLVLEPKATVT
jgi:hypothetical protein